jgi:uridine kinase
MKILITGASGSGTTTLGVALAVRLQGIALDSDDYYWLPTVETFTQKRDVHERNTLFTRDLKAHKTVVVSGSIMNWGLHIETAFDLIVFLYLNTGVRLQRLKAREEARFGYASPEFLDWAAQYDAGTPIGRNLASHTSWLNQRTCPVLRLEGDLSVEARLNHVLAELKHLARLTCL